MSTNFSVEVTHSLKKNPRVITFGSETVGPTIDETAEYPPEGSLITEVIVKPEKDSTAGNFTWWFRIKSIDNYEFPEVDGVKIERVDKDGLWTKIYIRGWNDKWSLKVIKNPSPFALEQTTNVTIGDD